MNAKAPMQPNATLKSSRRATEAARWLRFGFAVAASLLLWTALHRSLLPLSRFLAYRALGLAPGSRLGSCVEFFFYEAPKVLMLLVLVVGYLFNLVS
jgi:hypothetical protein